MNDQDTQITELEDEVASLRGQLESNRKDFEKRLSEMESLLKNHQHDEADGTVRLRRTISLLPGNGFDIGGVATFSGSSEKTSSSERTLAIIATGIDENANDGVGNSQIYMEHQQSTDATTRQTFFQGIRAPLFNGTKARVKTGETTLSQKEFKWQTNELDGAFISVGSPASFECYEIASNTERTLTVTGGTWGFSDTDASYTIFMPIYFGSANFPWRRLYTMDTSSGGIRFGFGPTAGGQNGLLYSDGQTLKYRRPNGTIATVVAAA